MKHHLEPPLPPETAEAVDGTPQRGKSRDSMLLVAAMQVTGRTETHQVRVRNLSSGGLMAEFDHPITIGTSVLVSLRGIGNVGGTVAWATQGRIGVALDREINPTAARKPVSGAKVAPMLDKPIKPIF